MEKKLQQIFSEALNLSLNKINDSLKYADVPEWDSVAHMALIAAIEEGFDVMIDAEDVVNMNSFVKAKEIVARHLR